MEFERLNSIQLKLLRLSLVVVWLVTGLVSIIELRGQSTALLANAGMKNQLWIDVLIWSGAVVDLALGMALWVAPSVRVYVCALTSMAVMTIVATLLTPSLWLHPLGPLLKNFPLGVIFWILIQNATSTSSCEANEHVSLT